MKMDKSVQITLIVVVGIILLALIAPNVTDSSRNTISVAGMATIDVLPDIVGIYFSVDTQGATVNEAGDRNTAIVQDLTQALAALGFNEEDIKTQSYNIYPE